MGLFLELTDRNGLILRGKAIDVLNWSMLAHEWLPIERGLNTWLDPWNFDNEGKQVKELSFDIEKL